MKRLLFCLCMIFFSFSSLARVRTVEMDSSQMKVITLAMGRSTVLQFADEPKKIVSGNSNYFNVEFTGNDVTIQPLSRVSSNLFIYSGQRRFGFILKVCHCQNYDDLVKVYWKPPRTKKVEKKAKKLKSFQRRSFKSGDVEIFVSSIFYHRFNDVYVVDGSFALPKRSEKPKSDQLWVTRGGKKLKVLDVVYRDPTIFGNFKNYRYRLFLKIVKPVDFTLHARFGEKTGKIIISKRSYQ